MAVFEVGLVTADILSGIGT